MDHPNSKSQYPSAKVSFWAPQLFLTARAVRLSDVKPRTTNTLPGPPRSLRGSAANELTYLVLTNPDHDDS